MLFGQSLSLGAPAVHGGGQWWQSAAYAGMAAIADFNNDRYAVTAVPTGSVAGATLADLLTLREATQSEFFAAYVASSTTARSYWGDTGTLKTDLAANAPRFDWTNGKRQLLLENQGTNLIRNNTMQGAVAGTPGTLPTNWAYVLSGLTPQIVGAGQEDGIDYLDIRLLGTPTTGSGGIRPEGAAGVAVTVGLPYTSSMYCRLVGGSMTNIASVRINMVGRLAGAVQSSDPSIFSGNFDVAAARLKDTRQSLTFTPTDAGDVGVMAQLFFAYVNGSPIDATFRIGLPQIEQSSFASSPIRTTGAAVTRAIETFRLSPLVEAILQRASGGAVVRGQGIQNPNSLGRILGFQTTEALIRSSGTGTNVVAHAASGVLVAAAGSGDTNGAFGAASAFDATGKSICLNGGAVASDTNLYTTRTEAYLARSGSGLYGGGRYDFLGILASKPANSNLQALAVPA